MFYEIHMLKNYPPDEPEPGRLRRTESPVMFGGHGTRGRDLQPVPEAELADARRCWPRPSARSIWAPAPGGCPDLVAEKLAEMGATSRSLCRHSIPQTQWIWQQRRRRTTRRAATRRTDRLLCPGGYPGGGGSL